MRSYTNIDQFINSLSDQRAKQYQAFYSSAIRSGKSEYEAKIDSAEFIIKIEKMSRDKSILRY